MKFVDYKLAKKLKEKGFRKDCIAKVNFDNTITFNHVFNDNIRTVLKCHNKLNTYIDAPTISQVLKWLKEKYFIHISTKPYCREDGLMWMYEVRKFSPHIIFVVANKTGFIKEEEAVIAGIEYVIDNLI